MFEKTRYQLLLSYLAVFASLLGIFALAVRVVFTESLSQQFTENLTILGQTAAANGEFEKGHLKVEYDFSVKDLITRNQALQWFDNQGNLVEQQGKYVLTLPLSLNDVVQVQETKKTRIRGVILPIIGSDEGRLIGYVRVSQSTKEFDETLAKLDWGLGSGVIIALSLSSIGGVWLTRRVMQPIEQSFLRLKQFTADASHELRSPLMAISTNAEVALEYPEEMRPKDLKKFKAIASAADQMTHLTEDLLLLARSDQALNLKKESVNIEDILDNLVQLYQPQADAKEINLSANLTGNLYVLGDLVLLTRVFANLIENALHYTPQHGTVEIQARRVGQQLSIKVKDTGIGMTPTQLGQIFERFWRADEGRNYRARGFGLGLAIAKS
ncbi:MAG: HAMP domain-containing sensor histidine kinase, partial [Coleofasciculaceae cyanobacterium]